MLLNMKYVVEHIPNDASNMSVVNMMGHSECHKLRDYSVVRYGRCDERF